MEKTIQRRRFLGKLGAILGGLVALPVLATPAQARSRRRYYGGWGGFRGYRGGSHRRFYGPGYGGYGGYGGFRGYGGYYAPRYYTPAPRMIVPSPGYYGAPAGGYYVPMMRLDTPARDALALLEL